MQGRSLYVLTALSAAALVLGVAFSAMSPDVPGVFRCGDFPGFYVLAEILSRGDPSRLYDMQLQGEIENQLWPACVHGGFFASLYPPFFAALLFPLSWFGPDLAGAIFRLINLLSLVGAIIVIRPLLASGRLEDRVRWLLISLLVLPLTMSLIGGQITGVVLLLLAGAARALDEKRDTLAGILCALLLIKPQYGVFALFFLACLRSWKGIRAAAVVAFIQYGVAAVMMGVRWPLTWLHELAAFGARNYVFNPTHQISLYGAVQGLLQTVPVNESLRSVLTFAAGILAVTALAIAMVAVVRGDASERGRLFLLVGPCIVLVSPQTLYYDLPIGLLALWPFVRLDDGRSRRHMLGLLLVIAVLTANFSFLPYPIFLPVTVLLFGLSIYGAQASRPAE